MPTGPHDDSVKILPYGVLSIHWLPNYTQEFILTHWNLPRVTPCLIFLLVLHTIAKVIGLSNFLFFFF